MQNRRHSGSGVFDGKYWLASGVVAAGLGAAMLAATGTAVASPGETGSSSGTTPRSSTDTTDSTSQGSAEDAVAPTDSQPEPDSEPDDEGDDASEDLDAEEALEVSDDEAVENPDDDVTAVEVSQEEADDGAKLEVIDVVDDDDAGVRDDVDDPHVPDTDADGERSDADDSPAVITAVPAARKESERAETHGREVVGDAGSTDSAALRVTVDAAAATDLAHTAPSAAAVTPTRITVGSMIVDILYSVGIRNTGLGADFLAMPVPRFIESWWQGVRTRIYRDIAQPEPEPGAPTDPPASADPDLLWESNFTDMDEALRYWGLQTGRWGAPAGENQYYTDGDNVYIDADGNLVIDARREAAPDGLGAPHNYTSARVVTYGKQSVGVGTRVVARIQMPVTQGSLPAFWSVGLEPGHEFDWPRQGEIDIVEIPGLGTPQSRRVWTGNIHGPSDVDNDVDVTLHGVDADLGVDLSQGFHEYGMDWYADRIVWHVDGVEVGSVTQAQYEALGGDWTPFSGSWDHYLILNVAVGNPWTGDPDPSAPFHAQMKVDWVKAYQL